MPRWTRKLLEWDQKMQRRRGSRGAENLLHPERERRIVIIYKLRRLIVEIDSGLVTESQAMDRLIQLKLEERDV